MTAFLLGLRASEVTDRVVRDLDDNGRLLWIEFGKTRRARRTLEIPALLRPYLLALARGRAADEQLISRTISRRSGKKRDRYWLAHHVERLCAEAGVPVVCTQSLRGLHASVATEAGATSHVVASALGHSSPAVTHAHYIDGDTARRARTRRVVGKVAPESVLLAVGDEPATAGTAKAAGARQTAGRAAEDGADSAPRVASDEPGAAETAIMLPPRDAHHRAAEDAAARALRVAVDLPAGAPVAATTAPRQPAARASGDAADPAPVALHDEPATAAIAPKRQPTRHAGGPVGGSTPRVIGSDAASAGVAPGEPTSSVGRVGNGQ